MGTAATTSEGTERRGPVLAMLRDVLAQGGIDDVAGRQVVEIVAKLLSRNSELERKLSEMLARGRKNEGVSTAQLLLLLDGLAADPDETRDQANADLRKASGIDDVLAEPEETPPPKRQPPLRPRIPPDLRRVPNPISVPAAQRPCPKCGKERKCIGHDVTEVIELIPAELILREDRREKVACEDCEGELARAPTGDKVVAGGRLGSTLVAQLVVDKYGDGLPLHRQRARFERMGLALPVSTLADQVKWATDLLRPLVRAAKDVVLAAKVMHLDGTGLPVQDKAAPKGKRLGTLWGYTGDETALYQYASTGKKTGQREGELGPADMLKLREGYTVADAATLFDESFKREGLIECGCNMHARRKFVAALDAGDTRAALPVAIFKKLYEIEEEGSELDRDAKHVMRQDKSAIVYGALIRWCMDFQPHEPPSSLLAAAIRYVLNHQDALTRFLDDPDIPLDNGAIERLHVRVAITRKNFLFVGSDAGGERAAIAYTILGSCALAGVNPVEYLTDILPKLARRIRIVDMPDLLPAPWKARRTRSNAPPDT